MPQNGFFSLRIAHIFFAHIFFFPFDKYASEGLFKNVIFLLLLLLLSRFLCTFAQKEFFSDGPKGIECIWELCACSRERQLAF